MLLLVDSIKIRLLVILSSLNGLLDIPTFSLIAILLFSWWRLPVLGNMWGKSVRSFLTVLLRLVAVSRRKEKSCGFASL